MTSGAAITTVIEIIPMTINAAWNNYDFRIILGLFVVAAAWGVLKQLMKSTKH
jgi:uncharacterized protein (DUF736 family)